VSADEIAQLRAENASLRAENASLEARLAEVERQLGEQAAAANAAIAAAQDRAYWLDRARNTAPARVLRRITGRRR
jgi:cell division septum initiation protein DivIVA